MATDTDIRQAVLELLDHTPLRGDVARARRRGEQLRRRRHSLVAGGVLAVLIASMAAFAVIDDDGEEGNRIDVVDEPSTVTTVPSTTVPPTTVPSTVPTDPSALPRGSVSGVAVDAADGDLWIVRSDSSVVQRWRSATEPRQLQASISLPGIRRVAIGAGHVWVLGDGDFAASGGEICVIDPRSNQPVTGYGADGSLDPRGVVFVNGVAWITDAANNRVLRLRMIAGALRVDEVDVGDTPSDIVATGDGSLWVREEGAGTIARIDTTQLVVAERHQWSGALLAAAGDEEIWSIDATQRLVALTPRHLAVGLSVAQGARLTIDPVDVVVDGDVFWVATRDHQVVKYSNAGTGQPKALASTSYDGDWHGMAPAGNSLLYTTSGTPGVARWTP